MRAPRSVHAASGAPGERDQAVGDGGPRSLGVPRAQARPDREVRRGRGAVGPQVADREFSQRLVAVTWRAGGAEPVTRAHETGVAVPVRAVDDRTGRRRHPDQMGDRLSLHRDPPPSEPFGDLAPGHGAVVGQHQPDQRDGAIALRRAHPFLSQPTLGVRDPRFGQQRHQPAVIVGGDQVEGAAHRPGPHDRVVAEARAIDPGARESHRSHVQAEFSGREHLRLHAGEVTDHVGGTPVPRLVQQLREETGPAQPVVHPLDDRPRRGRSPAGVAVASLLIPPTQHLARGGAVTVRPPRRSATHPTGSGRPSRCSGSTTS